MFLALDESLGTTYNTISCVCLHEETLVELEKNLVKFRLDNKLWGELKWQKISSRYTDKYIQFLEHYIGAAGVTFHTWTFKKPTRKELIDHYDSDKSKIVYVQAFLLIRSVIWKHRNSGYKGSYYILADSTEERGIYEYKTTNRLLRNDRRIFPKAEIDFCSTGASHICSALQIADLLAGATNHKYELCSTGFEAGQNKIIDYLEEKNNNVPLNLSAPKLPKLYEFKIHHCFFSK